MLQIQKKISSYNFNSSNSIKYIVIHDVGAYGTAKNNVDYFYGGNRGASAHYFVDDTSIWQSVEDFRGAWHVGDNNGYGKFAFGITNSNSIGIEMCLPSRDVTELTENNTIELVKYLMNKYDVSIERVVRHYDASRKNCPATFSANNWERWNRFKAKLNGQTSPAKPTEKPNTDNKPKSIEEGRRFVGNRCKELQEKLIKVGYDCGGYGADGKYGQGTHEDLIYFQKKYGLVVDGLAGNTTFNKLDKIIKDMNKPVEKPNPPSKPKSLWELCISGQLIIDLQKELNKQCNAKLKVDGYFGNDTLNKCITIRSGAKGNITKIAQKRLNALGYGTNGIDGIFGKGTHNAVVKFQKDRKLSADGIVGKNTWKDLMLK